MLKNATEIAVEGRKNAIKNSKENSRARKDTQKNRVS